ncbi:MAG: hypothetical protein GC186_00095 [Rhodobacteraceae bacterium]|nr:hypothetical protein [Paracoccaceae bacterium]
MPKIVPVILSGGSGTRLWPVSRKSYPKQFVPLVGSESLFQASVRRFLAPEFDGPVVVTGADFRFIVTEQLMEAGIDPGAIHRMENPAKVPMILIEVQTGSYLGEDDIIRYEDAYRRE